MQAMCTGHQSYRGAEARFRRMTCNLPLYHKLDLLPDDLLDAAEHWLKAKDMATGLSHTRSKEWITTQAIEKSMEALYTLCNLHLTQLWGSIIPSPSLEGIEGNPMDAYYAYASKMTEALRRGGYDASDIPRHFFKYDPHGAHTEAEGADKELLKRELGFVTSEKIRADVAAVHVINEVAAAPTGGPGWVTPHQNQGAQGGWNGPHQNQGPRQNGNQQRFYNDNRTRVPQGAGQDQGGGSAGRAERQYGNDLPAERAAYTRQKDNTARNRCCCLNCGLCGHNYTACYRYPDPPGDKQCFECFRFHTAVQCRRRQRVMRPNNMPKTGPPVNESDFTADPRYDRMMAMAIYNPVNWNWYMNKKDLVESGQFPYVQKWMSKRLKEAGVVNAITARHPQD